MYQEKSFRMLDPFRTYRASNEYVICYLYSTNETTKQQSKELIVTAISNYLFQYFIA